VTPIRVLFVCLGNICRSPTAEGVLRDVAAREAPRLRLDIDSAGTADYHIGAPPDPRSQSAARARGIDLSGLRARQIEPRDFERFDYILAMDDDNLTQLERLRPHDARARLQLFMSYAPQIGQREVPDPYYGGPEDFEAVLDLTSAAARGFIAALERP
jgi:protein-tyrosine phosphatase